MGKKQKPKRIPKEVIHMKEWINYRMLRMRVIKNKLVGKDNMHHETLALWKRIYAIENEHPEFSDRYHTDQGFAEQEVLTL